MSSPLTLQSIQNHLQAFERNQLDENQSIRTELAGVKRTFNEISTRTDDTSARLRSINLEMSSCMFSTQRTLNEMNFSIYSTKSEMQEGFNRVIAKMDDMKQSLREDLTKTDVKISEKIDGGLKEVKSHISTLHKDHEKKLDGLLHSTTDLYNLIREDNRQVEIERQDHKKAVEELQKKVDVMDQKQDKMMLLLQQISSKISPSS